MNNKRAIGLSVIGALALVLLLLAVTRAQAKPDAALPAALAAQADIVSGTISYQGRLLDGDGNPVDGSPVLTFSLYAQPSGGPPLWQDWFNVTVQDGLFHVILAPELDLFDGRALWLGIRVQGDPAELSPRQQLLPAPYALSLRPGARVVAALPGDPILRLVNDSAGPGVAGHSTSGPGVVGISQSDVGVEGQSSSGAGGTFTSTVGPGLVASSVAGHALVTRGPSLIEGPNPKQIALLRWYPAIQTPLSFTVGNNPIDAAFDGANMWITNYGDDTVSVLRASDGGHVMTPTVGSFPWGIAFDGANMWVVNHNDNTVSVLRASDGSHVMTPTVGSYPIAVAFDGANMWVVNNGDGTVSKR
jgi:hypothetical protein